MHNTLQINENLNALYIFGFIKLKKNTIKAMPKLAIGKQCIKNVLKKNINQIVTYKK